MRSERTTQETEFTPKEMAMILRTLSECIGFGTVAPVTEDYNTVYRSKLECQNSLNELPIS